MNVTTRVKWNLAPALVLAFVLAGCGELTAREKGAIAGGAIGMGSGAIIGGDVTGAVVGGAVGAAGGALLGDKVFKDDPKR